ncbi:MAG: MoaD/ThiS family protein [Euryarchaeota archaeon]|nr:MoaD/ThiS family protein [Euryarchaeota archaeon]
MQKSELDVLVQFKEKTHRITVDEGSNYEQLVRALMLNPEEVLIFVDGISTPSDEQVKPGKVRIVKIVSGG